MKSRTIVLLLSAVVQLLLIASPLASQSIDEQCNLSELNRLSEITIKSTNQKTIELAFGSSEGGYANFYYDNGELVAIRSSFFGEIGKTEIDYYFQSIHTYKYVISEYYYNMKNGKEPVDIVSLIQTSFVVCNDSLVVGTSPKEVTKKYDGAFEILQRLLQLR